MIKAISETKLRKYSTKDLKERERMLKRVEKKEIRICKETRCDTKYLMMIAEELGKTRGILIEKEVIRLRKEIK